MRFVPALVRGGALATAATTAALVLFGARDGDPAGPLNAVSHIAWGDRAASQFGVSAKYTAVGLALNAAAVTSWAALHALLFRKRGAWFGGAMVSAVAYATDYLVVPQRLNPGFERRLTPAGMLAVYAALALALGLATGAGRARVGPLGPGRLTQR